MLYSQSDFDLGILRMWLFLISGMLIWSSLQ